MSNPLLADGAQRIKWSMLPNKKRYMLELIQPLKAMAMQYRGFDSSYIEFCAECLEDVVRGNWHWIVKGTLCMVDFPVKTFESAWLSVSPVQRRQITEDDNVHIIFCKNTQKSMVFEYVERMKAKDEHVEFASKNYARTLDQKPKITRKEEY